MRLRRACRVGDGIVRLAAERHAALVAIAAEAARRGRFAKFVPASGAASRMFADLTLFLAEPDNDKARRAALALAERLGELAARTWLAAALAEAGDSLPARLAEGDLPFVVRTLIDGPGLALAARPKGLLPFHLYGEGPRTAFSEHLVEAAAYLADDHGRCRLHFTVSPAHEAAFAAELAAAGPRIESRLQTSFAVAFSHQEPATDTLALGADGEPFRDRDGALLLRPGGHGALLGNLQQTDAELVFVKNIDNVMPERGQAEVVHWQRLLGGLACELVERRNELWRRLAEPGADEALRHEAVAFLAELGHPAVESPLPAAEELRARLDRPLRVCGVVPNTGEPGGGPFWVADPGGGESRQIVESAQVDLAETAQAEVWKSATHFNPVQLVCALDDPVGRRYDLDRFVDPAAVFLAGKSEGGRALVALERPGLWNGAMAHWHTVFVDVPGSTFAPVKTLLDLARPEHRALPSPTDGPVASPGGRGYDPTVS